MQSASVPQLPGGRQLPTPPTMLTQTCPLGQALRVLDTLFQEGARGPEIVGALASQLERWKKGAARLAEGRTPEEIGRELRVPPFFQGAFLARLRRLPRARLVRLTRSLLECDEAFKSGRLAERPALERVIWTSRGRR